MPADIPSYSPHWLEDLQKIDRNYDFNFHRKTGKWRVVVYEDMGGVRVAVPIHWIQNDDGTPRGIDQRVINHIKRRTAASREADYIKKMDARSREAEYRAEKDSAGVLQDLMDDNKHIGFNRVYSYA